jgi:DNA-binding HxlR family transcriptional regulator
VRLGQDIPRSNCPINYSLELVGDAWSLLIIRDIVYFGKHTYGEFIASKEGIARNILAHRLAQLTDNGILIKSPHPDDGRKEMYKLTEKGLGLIPILLDMAEWGSQHYTESDAPQSWLALVRHDRNRMIVLITETVRAGNAIFVGEDSVVSKLENIQYNRSRLQ